MRGTLGGMSESVSTTSSRSAGALLYGGLLAIVVGGVVALIAKSRADSAAFVGELTNSLGGFGDTSGGVAVGFMWFGIVVAVLGAVMVITFLAVRAVTATVPPPPV